MTVQVPLLDVQVQAHCKQAITQGAYKTGCVNFRVMKARQTLRHPAYVAAQGTTPPRADLALIELEDDGNPPVSLVAKVDLQARGPQNITLAGYGRTLLPQENSMRLEIGYRFNVAWRDGERFEVVDEDMSSACHGDSGGPLFRGVPWGKYGETHRVYGVISYGKPVDSNQQCAPPYMVGFTRLGDAEIRGWLCRQDGDLCD